MLKLGLKTKLLYLRLNIKIIIMYSSEDMGRFYFQYQTEAILKGISIEQLCSRSTL